MTQTPVAPTSVAGLPVVPEPSRSLWHTVRAYVALTKPRIIEPLLKKANAYKA